MNSIDMSGFVDISSTIVQAVSAIVTAFLAVAIWRQTRNIATTENSIAALQFYNDLNIWALGSDENLKIACELLEKDKVENDAARRKRFVAFLYLNNSQAKFLAMQKGLLHRKYARQHFEQVLSKLLKDDDVFDIVCKYGYNHDFTEMCKSLRKKQGLSVVCREVAPGVSAGSVPQSHHV